MQSITQWLPEPRVRRPIVIVGAGGIVRDAHLPAYRKAGFEVAGLFDIDGERARATASQFGVDTVYGSLDEAIRRAPEGAVFDIATQPSAIPGLLGALPDGSPAMIQKPMGETLDEARNIRDLCRRKRLTVIVNFQLRFAPAILAARSLIEQGALGDLHSMDIRISVDTPWGLFPYLAARPRVEIVYHSIHYLDLVRSFLGDPRAVHALTVRHPAEPHIASTRSSIILNYGDDKWVQISTNHGHVFGPEHQESFVKWEGTRGAAKTRLGVLMNYPEGMPDSFEYCVLKNGGSPVWSPVELEGRWFPDAFIGSMTSLMRFLDGSSATLPTSVEDAYRTMALVEAAYASSDSQGMPVAYD
jgi:predicted dehydrogenase